MKKILKSIIKNRKITLLFVAVILAAGVFNYYVSPKQESPDFSIPYAMITTVYPGASQEDVDRQVTSKIEESLMQLDGYNTCSSYSSSNLSLVILELDFNADRDKVFDQLNKNMEALSKQLPEQALDIKVNTNITNEAGVILSLSSASYNHEQLNVYANALSEKLSSIQGVKKFESKGLVKQQVIVEVDNQKASALGISLNDVVNIVKVNNIDLPFGKVDGEEKKMSINIDETYKTIDDISNIIVGFNNQTGKIITLSDVASIYYEPQPNDTYYIYDHQNTVLLVGYFDDNQNILLIGDEIHNEIDSFNNQLPEGITLTELLFQPDEVDHSINNFMISLLLGVVLVILVVFLGMGFRNAIIISISIPMSVLISFSVMRLFHIVIHQVTISALILSLGMLVDNSIVISDSIQNYLDEGQKKLKACINGSRIMAVPVFTSTLTTIAAFAPFLFLNSIAGDYIKGLPQIVIITLTASYLVAVFIVPVLAYLFFKPRKKVERKLSVNRFFVSLLKKSLKAKWVVILVVILALGGTYLISNKMNTIFFPSSDKDIIYIDIVNNNSDDIDSTSVIAEKLSEMLDKEDGVDYFVTSIGGGLPRFNRIMYIYTAKPDISQIMVRVKLDDTSFKTNLEMVQYLQQEIDSLNLNGKITVKQLMYAFPMDEDIKIRISGDDIYQAKEHETAIYDMLSKNERLKNVNKSNISLVDEYVIRINEEKLAFHGISMLDIQNEISIATLGRTGSQLVKENSENDIVIKCDIKTIEDIKNLKIKSFMTKEYITMDQLISIDQVSALSTLSKNDGQYSVSVTADYNPDYDKKETLDGIKSEIDKLTISDCDITYDGEDRLIKDNFGQIGQLGVIALIFVFLILLIQFKSYIQPLIIFITIPLSAIGSIFGLYVTNQPLSFTALLGIVSLLGIVVNNAIILIDYINKETMRGIKLKDACVNATRRRLRPIFLTTVTTIIGLIPLAIGTSQLFKPLAIALMSGLLVSTLLTLIVIPVFVSMRKQQT
ncbi:MAG: efflux RND transporter permease subunit [Clostridia bacterium]|nr:efflux RND transporter permease subunit [Clostridia bacterium]